MGFIQLIIDVDSKSADKLSDIFMDLDALSATVSDQYEGTELEQPIFNEPGYEAKGLWDSSHLVVLYNNSVDIEQVVAEATKMFGKIFVYTTEHVDDQDWVRLTQSQFDPIKINDKLYIVPSWHESPSSTAKTITLDPGLAFGTGSHPTTFMCLDWISCNVNANTESVLDYGCGSGILAIAAKKFGAHEVVGVDIDTQAIEASLSNATINTVDIKFGMADIVAGRKFDVVVANILSNPLRVLAPALASLTQNKLILSGILDSQSDELIGIYKQWFDKVIVANSIDGWVLLECSFNI